MPNFRTGAEAAKSSASKGAFDNPFEDLSLVERHDMVMEVLDNLGARNIQERPGNEIFFSCLLPGTNHPNGDRNPSASINFEKMVSGCWVCGGGHFLWWVASVAGLESSAKAVDFIADVSGVAIDRPSTTREMLEFIDRIQNKERDDVIEPPVYDPSIIEPWKVIHPWLTEWRGIPEQNIMDLQVGYTVMRTRTLDDQWVDSHRIIIPHFFKGKLYGWQSRRIGDDNTPKYLATPDMPRDTTLYNFNVSEFPLVVVESPMTVVKHNHTCRMMATFGARVGTKQMDLMVSSRSKKIILWFDNDEAGWLATEQTGEYLMERGMVYVVDNPYAGDPADLSEGMVECLLNDAVIPFSLWTRPDPSKLVVSEPQIQQHAGV